MGLSSSYHFPIVHCKNIVYRNTLNTQSVSRTLFSARDMMRHGSKAYTLGMWLFFLKLINSFIHLWLCWVFVSVRGLSLVVAGGGHSSSQSAGLSLSRPLLLQDTGSRRAGSVVVAHGPSCSTACGIFPDQGSNPCPLHWQADSQPLRHQGTPGMWLFKEPQAQSTPSGGCRAAGFQS